MLAFSLYSSQFYPHFLFCSFISWFVTREDDTWEFLSKSPMGGTSRRLAGGNRELKAFLHHSFFALVQYLHTSSIFVPIRQLFFPWLHLLVGSDNILPSLCPFSLRGANSFPILLPIVASLCLNIHC